MFSRIMQSPHIDQPQPQPERRSTLHFRLGRCDADAYAAGFLALARHLPPREAAPAVVHTCPAALEAFLGGSGITVTGRWEEARGE